LVRIALAQINPTIGDFAGNVDRIVAAAQAARADGAALVVCPELSVCGYPPMDLLDHRSFVTANLDALDRLRRRLPPGLGVVVGHVAPNRTGVGKALHNVATLLADGSVVGSQAKSLLPTYDVFDEARYFEPAAACRPVPKEEVKKKKIRNKNK
jgi:NAD+ synthase (glutamine-hydrolysing)